MTEQPDMHGEEMWEPEGPSAVVEAIERHKSELPPLQLRRTGALRLVSELTFDAPRPKRLVTYEIVNADRLELLTSTSRAEVSEHQARSGAEQAAQRAREASDHERALDKKIRSLSQTATQHEKSLATLSLDLRGWSERQEELDATLATVGSDKVASAYAKAITEELNSAKWTSRRWLSLAALS